MDQQSVSKELLQSKAKAAINSAASRRSGFQRFPEDHGLLQQFHHGSQTACHMGTPAVHHHINYHKEQILQTASIFLSKVEEEVHQQEMCQR